MFRATRIRTSLHPIKKISDAHKEEMYTLFIKYYDNVNFDKFIRDFNKKEHVIVLRAKDDDAIVGFSTLTRIILSHRGRKNVGIFSGDTIVDKKYWGSTAIQYSFMKYIFLQRIRHPLSRVFWFLITKGYKTYLLMANNWVNYYPRYDKEYDPTIKALTRRFCESLYPGIYDDTTGLLMFGPGYQKLKEDVAEVGDAMKQKFPKIAFFEKINPTWREGTELPCLGEIDWASLFKRSAAFVLRRGLKNRNDSDRVDDRTPRAYQGKVSSPIPVTIQRSMTGDPQLQQLEKREDMAFFGISAGAYPTPTAHTEKDRADYPKEILQDCLSFHDEMTSRVAKR